MGSGLCILYGTHQMYSVGPAFIKDVKTEKTIFGGGCYKCK